MLAYTSHFDGKCHMSYVKPRPNKVLFDIFLQRPHVRVLEDWRWAVFHTKYDITSFVILL